MSLSCIATITVFLSLLPKIFSFQQQRSASIEQVCILGINLLIYFFIAGSINFLIADGLKFSHPLHHLGKGPEVNSDYNTSIEDFDRHLVRPLPTEVLQVLKYHQRNL